MSAALEGGFADPPIDAAHAFRAALDAMARPGRAHAVRGAAPPPPLSQAAGALLLTLCDADVGVWLAPERDSPELRRWLVFHTGCAVVPRAEADIAVGPWSALTPVADFKIGVPEYPDRSATLIVEVTGFGDAHRLTGPGIETEARLTHPDPAAARANRARFPLGIDLFLTCGDRLAAVPRTTIVEG